MFTKAIVLSETDFRGFVLDLVEWFRDEWDGSGDVIEAFEEFVVDYVEGLMDSEDVDEFVIFFGKDVVEVNSGEEFFKLIRREYKSIKSLLSDAGIEVGFEEKKRLRFRRKK